MRFILRPTFNCIGPVGDHRLAGSPMHGCLSSTALSDPYAPQRSHHIIVVPDTRRWWPLPALPLHSASSLAASAQVLAAWPLHCCGASLVHDTDDFLQHAHCHPLPVDFGAIVCPPRACARTATGLLNCFGFFSLSAAVSFFAAAVAALEVSTSLCGASS